MTVALMYHALYRDDDTSSITPEDLPYAVSEAAFVEQLDRLQHKSTGLLGEAGVPPEVIITFDDGHASNVDIALPHLLQRKLRAYFFITSDFVDSRDGFCSSRQVGELHRSGMMVGGHGVSHRFFDDLGQIESNRELRLSRDALAAMTGRSPESMSFPGGRYTDQCLMRAHAAGFKYLFGSDVGLITDTSAEILDRVAIRRSTTLSEFDDIVNAAPAYFQRIARQQQFKRSVRRVLGNRIYHGLYKSLSTIRRGAS